MKARCMVIAPLRNPIKITKKGYKEFLELDYDDFWEATHIWGEVEFHSYDYTYDISDKCDSDKTRLKYIDYLVNQKGFNI